MGLGNINEISDYRDKNPIQQLLVTDDLSKLTRAQRIARSFLASNPHIKDTKFGRSASGSFYDFNTNRIGVDTSSPDILAHELGHAARLADASTLYKGILGTSKRLARVNNLIATPLASVIALNKGMNLEDRRDILRKLALGSAVINSPNIFEELAASSYAVRHSDTPIRTGFRVIPGMVSHMLSDGTAPLTYLSMHALTSKDFK
jgi:hypothetical protein